MVGFAQVRGGEQHAFLYAAGKILDLGTLEGGTQSFAYAVNNTGQVVGASDVGSGMRAILYSDGRLIDLNTLLPRNSGWLLTEARDINDHGQIAGSGILNGHQRAFLLTP